MYSWMIYSKDQIVTNNKIWKIMGSYGEFVKGFRFAGGYASCWRIFRVDEYAFVLIIEPPDG